MQHTRLRVDRPSEDGEEKRAAIGRLRTGGAWFLYFYLYKGHHHDAPNHVRSLLPVVLNVQRSATQQVVAALTVHSRSRS